MKLFFKNWENEFFDLLSKTKNLKIISPFVQENIIARIQQSVDFSNFELITRYKLLDFALGVSSLSALKFALKHNANIYGIRNLHSKIYLFDKKLALITSANLTGGGLKSNYECGIITDETKIISELNSHFDSLKSSTVKLNMQECLRWEKIIGNSAFISPYKSKLPDYGSETVEKNNASYFIKFFGDTDSRAPMTYSIKEELKKALCHYACGFPENKKPRRFKDNDVIYMARITTNPNDFAIFGRAYSIKYNEVRDIATENEKLQCPWKNKWPVYLRLKNGVFLDGAMGDCVSLYDLIDTFDYNSFQTTLDRYNRGERNINPYGSLMQQPYVRLTQLSAQWLNINFTNTLHLLGKIEEDFISQLPHSDTSV